MQLLIDNLDRDLQYAIQVEGKMDLDSVINYDEVKNDIKKQVWMHVFQLSLTYKGSCYFWKSILQIIEWKFLHDLNG